MEEEVNYTAPKIIKEIIEVRKLIQKDKDTINPSDWMRNPDIDMGEIFAESIKQGLPLPDDFNPKNFNLDEFLKGTEETSKKVESLSERIDDLIAELESWRVEIDIGLRIHSKLENKEYKFFANPNLEARTDIANDLEQYLFSPLTLIMELLGGNNSRNLN